MRRLLGSELNACQMRGRIEGSSKGARDERMGEGPECELDARQNGIREQRELRGDGGEKIGEGPECELDAC